MVILDFFGFDNLPLALFFSCFLIAAEPRYKTSTIDSYRSRLLGSREPNNWVETFESCGVRTTSMDPYDVAAAKTLMKNACISGSYEFGHFDSALNVALRWGIVKKFVSLTDWDLKSVRQGKKASSKIVLAPDDLINTLRTKRLGETDFLHFPELLLVFYFNGSRWRSNRKEVLSKREGSIRSDLSMDLIRENGHMENIPYRRQDIEAFEHWVQIKKTHQEAYLRAGGKPAEDQDSLFINSEPVLRDGRLTWAMSNKTIEDVLKAICKTYGVEYVAPSILRRNSCVYGQTAAAAFGFHESYVSVLRGHLESTERDYYSRILGPEVEFINRLPHENIEFCERIIAHSINEFMENPRDLRHLACAWAVMQSLGRFEVREKLTRYRSGTLDLDRFPAKPTWANVAGINPSAIGKKLLISICLSLFRWFAK